MDDAKIAAMGKVLSSTLRVAILRDAPTWGEEGVSPAMWAAGTGEALGNVSYAFRMLERANVLALVSTRPRRGAVEHFYGPGRDGMFVIGVVEAWAAV